MIPMCQICADVVAPDLASVLDFFLYGILLDFLNMFCADPDLCIDLEEL